MLKAYFVYHMLMLSLAALWYPTVTSGTNGVRLRKNSNIALGLSVVVFSAVLGLRDEVGGDYLGYVGYFVTQTPDTLPGEVPYEIGYFYLIKILKFLGLGAPSLFVASCAIQIFFLSLWVRRFPEFASLFFLFYFLSLHAFEALNIVRQATAFSIILYATVWIGKQRFGIFCALIVLASTFHWSAMIVLPLYFLAPRRLMTSTLKQIVIYGAVYVFAGALSQLLFSYLPQLASLIGFANHGNVQEDLYFAAADGAGLGVVFQIATDLLVFLLFGRLYEAYRYLNIQIHYNFFLVGAFFSPVVLFSNYILFARLNFYFTSFKFILVVMVVSGLLSGRLRIRNAGVVVALIIIGYYVWFLNAIDAGAAGAAPFRFIF